MINPMNLYRLLKALQDKPVILGYVEERFSEELINFALKERYIDIEITPPGCPSEVDSYRLTPKGKKWLKNPMGENKRLEQFLT